MTSSSTDNAPQLIAFGGAFDPPHTGHTDAVRAVLAQFPNAEIVILPGAQPAGAAGVHKRVNASFAQRLAMCKTAFGGAPRVHVLPLEEQLPRPNYTVVTLKRLKELYPGRRLGFLIGQDQLESFHQWKDPRGILETADLIAVARRAPGMAPGSPAALRQAADAMAREMRLYARWEETRAGATASFDEVGSRLHLMTGDLSDAASSALRASLARSEPPPAGWLAPGVLSYIREQGLYGYGKRT